MGVIQNAVDNAITTATSMSYNNAFRKSMNSVEENTKAMSSQIAALNERQKELAERAKAEYNTVSLTGAPDLDPSHTITYTPKPGEYYGNDPKNKIDTPFTLTPEEKKSKYNSEKTQNVWGAVNTAGGPREAAQIATQSAQQKGTMTYTQDQAIYNRMETLKDGQLHSFTPNDLWNGVFDEDTNPILREVANLFTITDKDGKEDFSVSADELKFGGEEVINAGRRMANGIGSDADIELLRKNHKEYFREYEMTTEEINRQHEAFKAEHPEMFEEDKEYTTEDIDKVYDKYETDLLYLFPIKMNDNGEFELRHYTDQLPDTTYTDDEISKTSLSNLIEMAKDKSDKDIENMVENKFNIANKDEIENALDETRENINSENYDTDQGKFNFSNGYFADQLNNDLKNIDEYDKLLKVEYANAPTWKYGQIKETETAIEALKKLKKSENKEFFIGKILNDWRLVSDDGLTMRLPFGSSIKFKQDFETTDDSNIIIEGYAPKLLSDGNYDMRKVFRYKVSVPFFTEERRLPITYADGTEATNYDTFKLKTKDYYEDLAKTQDFINKCVRNLSDKPEKIPETDEKLSEIINELDRNLKNARKYEKYMEENKPEEWTKEAQDNAIKRRSKYVSDAMIYYYRYTKLYEEGKQYAELLNRLEKERKNKKGDK